MRIGAENVLRITEDRVKLAPDNSGYISVVIPLDSPSHYRFLYNLVCLSPGDSLTFVGDAEHDRNITFHGNAAEINNYLKDAVAAQGLIQGLTGAQPTVEKTIKYIFDEADNDEKRLAALTSVSEHGSRQD